MSLVELEVLGRAILIGSAILAWPALAVQQLWRLKRHNDGVFSQEFRRSIKGRS